MKILKYGDIIKDSNGYTFKYFVIGYDGFITRIGVIRTLALALKEAEPHLKEWPSNVLITECKFKAMNPIIGLLLPVVKLVAKLSGIN